MRIFVGFTDVANINAVYTKGFQALGHQIFSVTWSKSRFYPDSQYNLVIDQRQPGDARKIDVKSLLGMVIRMMQMVQVLQCETFIMFAPAVLPTHIYYPVLRGLGKKIVSAFWGSDIRHWYAFAEEMKSFGIEDEMSPIFKYMKDRSGGSYWDKLRTVRVAERYSDLILSQPDCAQLQTRPYLRANVPLDLSQYEFKVPGRKRPLVLHAPSVPEAKGTDVVLNVVQELKDEGLEFDFKLIQNMPNSELRQLLTESDIVVDELYSATVAVLSSEAMATGNAVLVRYLEDYSKIPQGCPAINTSKFTLKDNLRRAIVDVDYRKSLAYQGRPYVESNNDHLKICQSILDWLAQKEELNYDFYPSFIQSFQIPSDLVDEERRESTRKRRDFFKTLLATGATRRKS